MWINKNRKIYYLVFTVLFAGLFIVCYEIWFRTAGTSYIWRWDGAEQQYSNFVYIGLWLRKIVHSIIEGNPSLPMWDMSIGYGSDIFCSLGTNLFDPFHLASALVPAKYSEIAYEIMVVLKIYLCGLSFSWFSFYRKRTNFSTLIGALCYVFSAPMFISFKQEPFICAFYLFPLLMLGFEKIWNGEKPYFYIAIFAVSLLHSFYFMYMMVIMIVVFFLIKSIAFRKSLKNTLMLAVRYIFASVIGGGIGLGLLLPVVMNLIGTDRLAIDYYVPALFDKSYNGGILYGFFTEWETGNDAVIGFSALTIICIILLFVLGKKTSDYRDLKIMAVIGTIAFFIPYIGHVFNGMSYVTSRWIFGYLFLAAWITVAVIEDSYKLEPVKAFTVISILSAYAVITALIFRVGNDRWILTFALGLGTLAIIGFSDKIGQRVFMCVMILVTCLSVFIPSIYRFSKDYDNFPSLQIDRGTAYPRLIGNGGKPLLDDIDNGILTRYDEAIIGRWRNSSMITGISGMDFYDSLYNNNIDIYHKNLGLETYSYSFGYYGLNRRSNLERLNGVNSYIIRSGETSYLPYGFDQFSETRHILGSDFDEWNPSIKNDMVYSFKRVFSAEDYSKLNPYQREKALMLGVVLNGESAAVQKYVSMDSEEVKDIIVEDTVAFEVEEINGVSIQEGTITADKNNASCTFAIDPIVNSELYVYFGNLDAEGGEPSRYEVLLQAYNGETEVSGIAGSFSPATYRNSFYSGKHDWLEHLGYTTEEISKIKVTFSKAGKYKYDDLKIYVKPANVIKELNDSLKTCQISAKIRQNSILIDVDVTAGEYLYVSVPYSSGWKATIDGQEAEILKADDAFICIRADRNSTALITLSYETPYLKVGAIVSSTMLILFLAGIITDHIIRTRKKMKSEEK